MLGAREEAYDYVHRYKSFLRLIRIKWANYLDGQSSVRCAMPAYFQSSMECERQVAGWRYAKGHTPFSTAVFICCYHSLRRLVA